MTNTLGELIKPIDANSFVRNFLGQHFVHSRGESARFAPLLPWSELNSILGHHHMPSGRLELWKQGRLLAPESYTVFQEAKNRSGSIEVRSQLLPVELTTLLRDGATLVLHKVDSISEAIGTLAEDIERSLKATVHVNVYASWRTDVGFNVHFDDHDVFILQVHGKKHWAIYGPVPVLPMPGERAATKGAFQPPVDPVWEAILNEGDVLYIPRGWWHMAAPRDEPTCHLTVGVVQPTGADLLDWVTSSLKKSNIFRVDLPQHSEPFSQGAYLSVLRQELFETLADPNLLSHFIQHKKNVRVTRPIFSLPWTATPAILPNSRTSKVKALFVKADILSSSGSVEITFNNKGFSFDSAALDLLNYLADHPASTIEALIREFSLTFTDDQVLGCLEDLAVQGLLVFEDNCDMNLDTSDRSNEYKTI